MHKYLIGACLACAAATPALASEPDAAAATASDWSISASGGLTKVDGDGDQPFMRLSATRFIGDGYVRASVTRFATREGQGLVDAVPARTVQIGLGGGYTFGKVSIDGYASLGWRHFDAEAFRHETGRMVEVDSHGKTAGLGLSVTYEVQLGEGTFLSPYVAGDVNRVDIARAIEMVGRGTIAQKEHQSGVTGSLGFTLDHKLGESGHNIGVYAAFIVTSNSAVQIRSSAPVAAARLFGPQDVAGASDSWAEYGASATLRVSKGVMLDFSAVRTAGFAGGESNSFSAGARVRF